MKDREPRETPDGTEEVLYSALVCRKDGQYILTVTDVSRDVAEEFPVQKKAVDRLPSYLAMLRGRLS